MVFDDPFAQHHSSSSPSLAGHQTALASPQDRLAAVVVDYLVLIPLFSVALAPLKRVFYEGQLLGNNFFFHFELIFAFLIIFVVGTVYQGLFVYYRGATPGKLLLQIQVQSIWPGHRITLTEAFLRAGSWWLECFILFIPHLAVCSGRRRRPAHDRLADTVVVTQRWRGVTEPSVSEANFARGIAHAALFALLSLFLITLVDIVGEALHQGRLEQAETDCALSEDLELDEGAKDRDVHVLERQMALYAAGSYPLSCMRSQADRVLAHNGESGLAYLAKAFVFADDTEKSDQYLREVCSADGSSESCAFSQVVSAWNRGDWRATRDVLVSMKPIHSEFVRFWAARHFYKTRDFLNVLEMLGDAPMAQDYAKFVLSYRLKASWQVGDRHQARLIYQTHAPHLPLDEKIDLSSWLCQAEMRQAQCQALTSTSCQSFLQASEGKESTRILSKSEALTDIKLKICRDGESFNFRAAYFAGFGDDIQDYLHALELAHRGKISEARNLLSDLVADSEATPITVEAQLKLIEWAPRLSELSGVRQEWQGQDPFEAGWSEIGQALMDRYAHLGDANDSLRVGVTLYRSGLATPSFIQRLAEVRKKTARDWQGAERMPASEEKR